MHSKASLNFSLEYWDIQNLLKFQTFTHYENVHLWILCSLWFIQNTYSSSHFLTWANTSARWWMVSRLPRGIWEKYCTQPVIKRSSKVIRNSHHRDFICKISKWLLAYISRLNYSPLNLLAFCLGKRSSLKILQILAFSYQELSGCMNDEWVWVCC